MELVTIALQLKSQLERLTFAAPVTHVYDPLEYAWAPHRAYLERYGQAPREVLLVGMNPGPWGMAQTGVPFGDVGMVRDWLGIHGPVAKPALEHPKRPVLGFACRRGEGSGRRLWGWARATFATPERFFDRFFVVNYCPLCFFLADGQNLTPDKLPSGDRRRLFSLCDGALAATAAYFRPRYVVGVGRFATQRASEALAGSGILVGYVPHPSPANPAANRGWTRQMEAALAELGIAITAGDGLS